jgi:ribosomal subunit interface protein
MIMPISITGKHIEVGDSLRDFINQELRKVVSHYMGDILEAHVTVSKEHATKERFIFKTDVSVHITRNLVVHCHGHDEDAYRSVTNALQKLESRIRRYKTRLRDRKRHRDDHPEIPAQQYILQSTEEDIGEDTPLIIAEMTSQIHQLSVGEAVMRMDLSESPVVMFRNAANGELNVVYKRADGHIGWIDPTKKV